LDPGLRSTSSQRS
ncbi:hypothetical protein IOCL1545_000306200, partial [Leishmania shawi]